MTTQPTQIRHPWRATVRTAFAAIVGFLPLAALLAHELGVESVPWVAGTLAVIAGITRWLAYPGVNRWFTKWLNMGAAPKQ